MKKQSMTLGLAAVMLVSSAAMAQDPEASADANVEKDGEPKAEAATEADEPPEAETTAVAVETAPETKVEIEVTPAGDSDHDTVIGHFGVGYMGLQTMTLGATTPTDVSAPIIGARYWITDLVGIDFGFGVNFFGGNVTSTQDGVADARKIRQTVGLAHIGVPLNFYDRGSFSFQLVPEATMGWARTSDQDTTDNKLRDKGYYASVGAHVGAEIQFGFIGLPNLALQGNVGLYRQTRIGSTVSKINGDKVRVSDRTTTFGTGTGPDPWDLFAGNIAALYYF